jgi:hypothetical protein
MDEGMNMKLIDRVLKMESCAMAAAAALIFGPVLTGRADPAPGASKHYSLPATPENVQWGWYDPTEKPKLVIHSGSVVGDCRVTQVVDIRKGVHCMIPKAVFVKPAQH